MAKLLKAGIPALLLFLTSIGSAVEAFALSNPATGDESGPILTVMIALLIISVVLIVAYVIFTLKRKKK